MTARPASQALLLPVLALLLGACGGPSSDSIDAGASDAQLADAAPDLPPDAGRDPYEDAVRAARWVRVPTAPSVGGGAKQDDMFWLDANRGFVANGPGTAIYATTDGGEVWSPIFSSPGTYFRALYFIDPMHGFAGNLGTGLSSSITDDTSIYQTDDGGSTWAPVTAIDGPAPSGICNFTAVDATHLFAVGRANGPSHLLRSSDAGATWTSIDLGAWLNMAIDAHFSTPMEGIVAGMGRTNRCTILRTTDGGTSFETVFESATRGSLCWKLDFPSSEVGYVAVQDTTQGPGTFGRTRDGGLTWEELPLPVTGAYPAIGVGFITPNIGWMAPADPSAQVFRTFDGGDTWEPETELRGPINRFRFIGPNLGYAVGATVWRLVIE